MTEIEFARRHLTVDQQSCKSYAEQELFQEDIDRSVGEEHLAFCILWSPLPFITWLLPFIGHLGIADSKGKDVCFISFHLVPCKIMDIYS